MARLFSQRALGLASGTDVVAIVGNEKTIDQSNDQSHSSNRLSRWRLAAVALASLACVACGHDDDDDDDKTTSGGGGSSSSSSSSSSGSGSSSGGGTTNPPATNSPFAGNYSGTVELTATSSGIGSTSDSFAMTATINNAGVLTFRSEQVSFTATVNDNGRFSKSFQFDQQKDNTRCSGTLAISGRVTSASGVMDGNVSGPLNCERGILKVSGTAKGSFNARR